MIRLRLAAVALAAVAASAALGADSVAQSEQGVVRIIEVVGEQPDGAIYTGSGFAVTSNRIVTNAHVVEDYEADPGNSSLTVVPSNSRKQLSARIIEIDRDRDLALLEVDGVKLAPLSVFGGAFREGSPVVALGYPGNVDMVTQSELVDPEAPVRSDGNFSNLRRVQGTEALLHTASIAHGNSGGPLLDACGRVIGVNTYVTPNERGDSSFGFAISFNELRSFLRRAGQAVSVVEDECVPPDVAASRDAAAKAQAELDATKNEMERRAAADAQARSEQAAIGQVRENRLIGAGLLVLLAALAAVFAMISNSKNDARKTKIAGIGAAVLFAVALGVFFSRPPLAADEITPTPSESGCAGCASEDASTATGAPGAAPAAAGRKLSCAIDDGRSTYASEVTQQVDLAFNAEGCVNDRTQYIASGNGAWQRVAVPKSQDRVSRMTFDPETMTYTEERWQVDSAQMETLRSIKDKAAVQSCGLNQAQRRTLASTQHDVMNAMTAKPDERIVYRCTSR